MNFRPRLSLLPILALVVVSAILLLVIAQLVGARIWIGITRTPELLGDAQGVFLRLPERTFGLTWSDYALFFVHGIGSTRIQCQAEQLLGGPIGQYEEGGIDCLIIWRGDGKFRGWIDFRGHTRAFCGAETTVNLPKVCFWR